MRLRSARPLVRFQPGASRSCNHMGDHSHMSTVAEMTEQLRALVEAQPRNVAAQLWLAQTLMRTGRPREAIAAYQRAIALPGGARDALAEAVDAAVTNGAADAAELRAPQPPKLQRSRTGR